MRVMAYRDIVVRPSDHPGYDPAENNLINPDERNWWQNWCHAEGEFQALRAEHTQDELESIAQKAGYADWSDVEQRLINATDDDTIVSIEESVVSAA
jgi:hypothetical protein